MLPSPLNRRWLTAIHSVWLTLSFGSEIFAAQRCDLALAAMENGLEYVYAVTPTEDLWKVAVASHDAIQVRSPARNGKINQLFFATEPLMGTSADSRLTIAHDSALVVFSPRILSVTDWAITPNYRVKAVELRSHSAKASQMETWFEELSQAQAEPDYRDLAALRVHAGLSRAHVIGLIVHPDRKTPFEASFADTSLEWNPGSTMVFNDHFVRFPTPDFVYDAETYKPTSEAQEALQKALSGRTRKEQGDLLSEMYRDVFNLDEEEDRDRIASLVRGVFAFSFETAAARAAFVTRNRPFEDQELILQWLTANDR